MRSPHRSPDRLLICWSDILDEMVSANPEKAALAAQRLAARSAGQIKIDAMISLARADRLRGETEQAKAALLLAASRATPGDGILQRILPPLAYVFRDGGQAQAGETMLELAAYYAVEADDTIELGRRKIDLGIFRSSAGDFPVARRSLEHGLRLLGRRSSEYIYRAAARLELGDIADQESRHSESERLLASALTLVDRMPVWRGRVLWRLALVVSKRGRQVEAVELLRMAIALATSSQQRAAIRNDLKRMAPDHG